MSTDPVGSTFWQEEIDRLKTALASLRVGVRDGMDATGNRLTVEKRRQILEDLAYAREQYNAAVATETPRGAIVLKRRKSA